MIVRQLLEMCIKEKLVKNYFSMLDVNNEEYGQEEKQFCDFFYNLMRIEPQVNNNMILLLSDYIDEGINYIDVTLYKISEVEKEFKFCKEYDKYDDIKQLTYNDIVILKNPQYNIIGYAVEFSKWKEVLGYKIDEDNVSEYGIEKAAAAILYEITYFGYDQVKISDEINIIDAADKKLDEFKNKDDYESVHCMTMGDINAQLEIPDNRTTIEIENDNRRAHYEHICNCINAYKVIKKYYIKNLCKYDSINKSLSV